MRPGLRAALAMLVVATLFGALLSPAAASHTSTLPECPEPVPMSSVRSGVSGTGYTVASGNTRSSFEARVLGVLPDGLGPGRDMIIVEASGPVIEDNGGIWAGMSGSPIFVGDRLLGAIAFGLAAGESTVAGVTPAEEMYQVLNYPDAEDAALPRRVRLTDAMRKQVARATGAALHSVDRSFEQLWLPFSISGATGRMMDSVAAVLEREKLPLIPYAGSSASAGVSARATTLRPGDNIVGVVSYGDVTTAGVGTVTFVCEGRAMAFGHPFLWEGATKMGANASTTIAVIQDPFLPYELGTIDGGLGTLDQDRFAGVRTVFGATPPTIPFTSSVSATNTGRTRDGRSDVVISEALPFVAFLHTYGNIQFTMDQYTEGSSELSWTITGTTESGGAFTFSRSNMYASDYAISEDSAYELADTLYALYYNQFEDIEFTSVDLEATADGELKRLTIADVLVAENGSFVDKRRVTARPGQKIRVRVVLEPYEGNEQQTVDLTVRVPTTATSGGVLQIKGGTFDEQSQICFYEPEHCRDEHGKKIKSFQHLIDFLQSRPGNNELVANLRTGNRNRIKAQDREALDQVVFGEKAIFVRVPGFCCGGTRGGGGVVSEPGYPGDGGGGE